MVDGRFEGDGVRLLDFGLADAAGRAAVGTDELLNRNRRVARVSSATSTTCRPSRPAETPSTQGAMSTRRELSSVSPSPAAALSPCDRGQTMRAHLEAPPPVPSVADPRIPRALDRVVVRAMLKEPSDRFPSAAAMRTALAAAVPARKPEPAAASPSPAPDHAHWAPDDVTRVLGRTIVRRATFLPWRPSQRLDRSGVPDRARAPGSALAAAAVVVAVIVVAAASSAPTVSVAEESTHPPPRRRRPLRPALAVPGVPSRSSCCRPCRISRGSRSPRRSEPLPRPDSSTERSCGPTRPLRADTVLETRPAAGRALAAGEPVSLIVASGANTIPDVAGQGRDAAASMLQAAGFAPSFAYRTAPLGTPVGAILGTDPVAGTLLAVGTPLTVYEAVPAPSPSPVPVHPLRHPRRPSAQASETTRSCVLDARYRRTWPAGSRRSPSALTLTVAVRADPALYPSAHFRRRPLADSSCREVTA